MSLFPIYLVPPVPFRRRQPNPNFREEHDAAAAVVAPEEQPCRPPKPATTTDKGYLTGQTSRLRCARCAADLCPTSQIVSKGFTGRHGRAYLVSASPVIDTTAAAHHHHHHHRSRNPKTVSLPNTRTHKAMPRQLVTGAHTVSDVSCAFCGSVIGWKYDSAEEETQRYKVGKYILETRKVFSSSCWENEDDGDGDDDDDGRESLGGGGHRHSSGATTGADSQGWGELADFDSQDEDECEDLFAGVWSPALAVKRRQGKRFGRPPVD
ncbi:MAG: hypothetical protein L6R36_005568 [Xanthoria steineri]|nr:MAG: hypothetical protein L6R36_005568 [Xanthoria steineri]